MLTPHYLNFGVIHARNIERRAKQPGFTLVEVVITMLIVAILAAVAWPSYASYISRARRADARSQLLQVAQFMQRFYAANDSFLQDRAGNKVFGRIPASLSQSPADTTKIYSLVIPDATLTDSSFEIRMVPVERGLMSNDERATFTLTSAGVRGVLSGTEAANTSLRDKCWR